MRELLSAVVYCGKSESWLSWKLTVTIARQSIKSWEKITQVNVPVRRDSTIVCFQDVISPEATLAICRLLNSFYSVILPRDPLVKINHSALLAHLHSWYIFHLINIYQRLSTVDETIAWRPVDSDACRGHYTQSTSTPPLFTDSGWYDSNYTQHISTTNTRIPGTRADSPTEKNLSHMFGRFLDKFGLKIPSMSQFYWRIVGMFSRVHFCTILLFDSYIAPLVWWVCG